MTSEVKTEARFGLSGPSYLLDPVFEAVEAEIGLIIPKPASKKLVSHPKKKKDYGKLPYKTAGSAAVKITLQEEGNF